ncbi:MAG: DUF58 domain-containing protein [Pseudomonadota bacterium]
MIAAERVFARATGALRESARGWAKRRQGSDHGRVELSSRRVYILPNLVGLTFGLTAFVMLLGSMNYNNSLAFALTFALAAIGLVAMHHTHGNLSGLVVRSGGAESVFAGEALAWRVVLENPSASDRFDLCVTSDDDAARPVDVAATGSTAVTLTQPAPRRGRIAQPRYRIRTGYPLGMFVAWGWLHPTSSALVWPAPAERASLPPPAAGSAGSLNEQIGDEDFAGLRDYQPGDAPSRIAWRSLARAGDLSTKKFAGAGAGPIWLELAHVDAVNVEQALSILTRQLLDAQEAGLSYGLALPARRIEPDSGMAHRNRCLDALALFGHDDALDSR